MDELRIRPSGDQAITVTIGNHINEEVNNRIMGAAARLSAKRQAGITEVIPSYNALEIFYRNDRLSFRQTVSLIREAFSGAGAGTVSVRRLYEIPCCYHAYFAPDLQALSEYSGLSADEIIRIHSGRDYHIFMMGFLPGFPYLGGMDKRLAMPRLRVPRKRIPAGSVGIGGEQTGIYPLGSPGGWHLIGRTPVDLYNPAGRDPVLLHAGDYIRFIPISTDRYYEIRQQMLRGVYRIPVRETAVLSGHGQQPVSAG